MPKRCGRRLARAAKRVPRAQVDYILGRVHVGTSYLDVARLMWRRSVGWPVDVRRACVRYAFKVHRRNRDLYAFVMRGR